jgi:hypothetical protein
VFERLRAPFRLRGFLTLTLLMAVWTAAQSLLGYTLAMPGFFSMVHLREKFGATYFQASLIFISAALGAGLFTRVLGPWIDRAGAAAVLRRLLLWAPLSMTAWWLAAPGDCTVGGQHWPVAVVWMSVAGLAQGAFLTGAFLSQFRLTQMCTREEGRTVAMAVHWSIAGFGGAAGAILGGWLKGILREGSGMPWLGNGDAFDVLVLLHIGIAWLLAYPLCRRLERELAAR